MNTKLKTLIVEDHPLTAIAYKNALEAISEEEGNACFVEQAFTCDEAIECIEYAKRYGQLDLVFLDINLPLSKNKKIRTGEDLGMLIKAEFPETKIVISTTYYDNFRIQSIIKNVNPDGYLVKNDITPEILKEAIKTVLHEPPFYSKTVLRSFRQRLTSTQLLDKIDMQLLYELSIGTKMKDLPKILLLSLAGVEKRKRNLREIFEIDEKDDRALVIVAKQKGFL